MSWMYSCTVAFSHRVRTYISAINLDNDAAARRSNGKFSKPWRTKTDVQYVSTWCTASFCRSAKLCLCPGCLTAKEFSMAQSGRMHTAARNFRLSKKIVAAFLYGEMRILMGIERRAGARSVCYSTLVPFASITFCSRTNWFCVLRIWVAFIWMQW